MKHVLTIKKKKLKRNLKICLVSVNRIIYIGIGSPTLGENVSVLAKILLLFFKTIYEICKGKTFLSKSTKFNTFSNIKTKYIIFKI